MANTVYVLPDPILLLIQYLRLRPEVRALVASGNIIDALPKLPTDPYVLITWAGGAGIWPAVADDALQVDAYGGTKEQCSLLARTVRAAIWAINGDVVPAGVLSSAAEELAPQWLPDQIPSPPLSRFVARYRIVTHP